jgi:hypothetical protein
MLGHSGDIPTDRTIPCSLNENDELVAEAQVPVNWVLAVDQSGLPGRSVPTAWESRQELKEYALNKYGVSLDGRMTIPNMLIQLEEELG